MKPLHCFLFLILCFVSPNSIGQKQGQARIDSFFSLLKADKPSCNEPCLGDTTKVKHLNALAWEMKGRNPDTAIALSNEALKLSEKINWQIGIGHSYNQIGWYIFNKGDYSLSMRFYSNALHIWDSLLLMDKNQTPIIKKKSTTLANIGLVYSHQGDYPKALDYYFKALKMNEEIGNKAEVARLFGNIGIVNNDQGDYPKALDYYFKALKIFEELNDKFRSAIQLTNIGIVYSDQGDNYKALNYYFRALKTYEELKDKMSSATQLSNIGSSYYEQQNYPKALEYYLKALKIDEELGLVDGIETQLSNIGEIYKMQGNYLKAVEYDFRALKIDREIGNKPGIAINLAHIGTVYTETKKYAEAEKYLLQALKISDSIGAINLQNYHHNYLSALYERTGNFKKALEHYQKAIAVKDSLFNEEKTKEITRKEMNYEFDKQQDSTKAAQEKKEALSNAEIGKQKVIRNAIAGGAGVLGLSSILSFLFYKRKRDAEQRQKETTLNLQVSETEMKALRSQMNPHFIFNALVSIRGFLKNHKPEDAEQYLEKFSYLMRFVVDNSQEREIPLEKDLEALKQYMELESVRKPFTYQFKIDESIDTENTTIPPLILQPFVENAIKHGLQPKDEPGHIIIYIGMEEGTLKCIVEDNGVGRDLSKKVESPMLIQKESMGMKLTEERLKILNELKKIKAHFRIVDLFTKENKPAGTRVELSLPLRG